MPPLLIGHGEFQIGEDGPIVKITAGKVEIKSADDSEYVTLKANFESAAPAPATTSVSVLRMTPHASPPVGLQNNDIWMNATGALIQRRDGDDFYLVSGDPI